MFYNAYLCDNVQGEHPFDKQTGDKKMNNDQVAIGRRLGVRFIKIATVYFLFGVIFGLIMGMQQMFQYAPVHAHLNLLGWASLALAGIIYYFFPQAGSSRLAIWHFWLHNIGLPIMMVGLFCVIKGLHQAEAVIGIGATIAVIGIALFAINVFRNVNADVNEA